MYFASTLSGNALVGLVRDGSSNTHDGFTHYNFTTVDATSPQPLLDSALRPLLACDATGSTINLGATEVSARMIISSP